MEKKTIVITGASRGIGRAIAVRFAAAGCRLALCCRSNTALLEDLQRELAERYDTECIIFTGDIGDFDTACRFFDTIGSRFGQIDILVNNAGISYVGLLTDMSFADWQHIINTNLTSVFNCCRLAIPGMVHRKSGKIFNISSVWGCCGASCEAAYSATKGGINAFTQALAKELAPSNIQVNAIACGAIDTEMNACFSREERDAIAEDIPTGRFGRPEEAAALIYDLSDGHTYLTGQIIRLDGGWI